jgi:hypothetical protein
MAQLQEGRIRRHHSRISITYSKFYIPSKNSNIFSREKEIHQMNISHLYKLPHNFDDWGPRIVLPQNQFMAVNSEKCIYQ